MTLQELSARVEAELEARGIGSPGGRVSAVPNARTIRYYATMGIVDKPLAYEGGVARYGERHVLQLLAVKHLQAQFLPLPEIQRRLLNRSDAELAEIVRSAAPPPPPRADVWRVADAAPGLTLVCRDVEALRAWCEATPSAERARILGRVLDGLM